MRRLIVGSYPLLASTCGLAVCGLGLLTPVLPAIGGVFVLSQLTLLIVFVVTTVTVFRWMDAPKPGASESDQGQKG